VVAVITDREWLRAIVLHLLAIERPWARRLRLRRERMGRR